MLSIKFPFTLSRSHFKRSVKGRRKKNILSESFAPVSPRKIEERLKCYRMNLHQKVPTVFG